MFHFDKKNTTNCCAAFIIDIGLRSRSRIIRGVMGHTNENAAMLRRSSQVLLVAENDHFGEVGLSSRSIDEQCQHTDCCVWVWVCWVRSCFATGQHAGLVMVQLSPTFKVVVLRDHEELSGLSQHCTIRICMSHDCPGDSGAFAQLYIDQRPDTTICCVYFAEMKQGRKSFCGCAAVRRRRPPNRSATPPRPPGPAPHPLQGLVYRNHNSL